MNTDFEDQVRDRLRAHATQAPEQPGLADRIASAAFAGRAAPRPARARWLWPLAVAAAVVALAAVSVFAVSQHHSAGPAIDPTAPPTISAPTSPQASSDLVPVTSEPVVETTPPLGHAFPPPVTTAAGITRCANAELSARAGSTNGAAGTTFHTIYLTNTGSGPCTLSGIPQVTLLDTNGAATGTELEYPHPAPVLVQLAPGHAAQFTIDVNAVTQTGCTTAHQAAQARIQPPGSGSTVRTIAFPAPVCSFSVSNVG